jgi:prephenate dehydrogenase
LKQAIDANYDVATGNWQLTTVLMLFNHICVVGVGLVGGSFALAARKAGIAKVISGWDEPHVVESACSLGIVDSIEYSFSEGRASQADLIYLAAPVAAIINFMINYGAAIKSGAIVTDAGSAKREICRVARERLPHEVAFVGGHPMAGSHKSGFEFASADLFVEAPYAVVIDGHAERDDTCLKNATEAVVEVVRRIGAREVMLSADEHDRVVAQVSHAPQLLSIALALAAQKVGDRAIELAGAGFRDMTRLAASNWSVWEDICRENADEITAALGNVISELDWIRGSILKGSFADTAGAFEQANTFLRNFEERSETAKISKRE